VIRYSKVDNSGSHAPIIDEPSAASNSAEPENSQLETLLNFLAKGDLNRALELSQSLEAESISQLETLTPMANFVLLEKVSEGEIHFVEELARLITPALMQSPEFTEAFHKGINFLIEEKRFAELHTFVNHFDLAHGVKAEAQSLFREALVIHMPGELPAEFLAKNPCDILSSEQFRLTGLKIAQNMIRAHQYGDLSNFFQHYPQLRSLVTDTKNEMRQALMANPLRGVPDDIVKLYDLNQFFEGDEFQNSLENTLRAEFLRGNLDGVAILSRDFKISDEVRRNLKREMELLVKEALEELEEKREAQLKRVEKNPTLVQAYLTIFGNVRSNIRQLIEDFALSKELLQRI